MNDEEIIYGSGGSHMMESLQQSSPSPTEHTPPAEQVKIENSVGAASAAAVATNNASAEEDNRKPNVNGDGTGRQRLQARFDSFARDDGTTAAPATSERTGLPVQQNVNEEASRRRRNSPERTNTRRSASTGPSLTQPPPRSYRLRTRDQKRPRRQERPPPNAFAIEVHRFEQQHAYPGAYSVPGMTGNAPDIGDHPASQSSSSNEDSVNGTGRFCNLTRRKLLWLSIVIIVVIVSTIVATVVVLSSNSSVTNTMSDDLLDETTNSTASVNNRFSKWLPFLKETSDNKTLFNNPTSPQSKALHWLVYEDSLSNAAADATYITPTIMETIKQRYMMALFYFSTGGGGNAKAINNGSWQNMYNFLSPSLHECNWNGISEKSGEIQGIFCNEGFRLSDIIIEGNVLRGTIPIELASVPDLTILRLSENGLTGKFPNGAWQKLKVVDLSRNQISGDFRQFIKGSLLELNVSHNNLLQGMVPTYLFRYSKELEVVDLSNCSFSGGIVNTNIEELTSLRTLRLDDNSFTGSLPSSLRYLTALSVFSASRNQLTGTFPWIHLDRVPLSRVEMSHNKFSSVFPPSSVIDSLSLTLEHFDFSHNLLVSTIPDSIGQWSMLKDLVLGNNDITGTLPSSLTDLTMLRTLDVSENRLQGLLPSNLANCYQLEDLILNGNLFTGTIPEELALLSFLDHATFHDNSFSGDIEFLCQEDGIRTLTVDCFGESPKVQCSPDCCECHA